MGENTDVMRRFYRPRNTKLRYSCDAIAMANSTLGPDGQGKVVWWREMTY